MARPLKTAAGLSVQALTRTLKILDKVEKAKVVDRLLKMLDKAENIVEAAERLMKLLANLEILASAFDMGPKKATKKKAGKKPCSKKSSSR